MSDETPHRDIELPEAMTPEERLRRIARLLLKAIRIHEAKKAKPPTEQPVKKPA